LGLGVLAAALSPLAALATLLGAALFLALLRYPLLGLHALLGLIFLLPFAVLPLRLGAQLTALEALLGLTLGASLLRGLTYRQHTRPLPAEWLLLAVGALTLLSFTLSGPYAGRPAEVGRPVFKLVLAILVFPLAWRLAPDAGRASALLRTLALVGGLEAALAVGLHVAPRDLTISLLSALGPLGYPTGPVVIRFLPGENDTYTDIARATGTSIDPNVLGGVLMLAAAVQISQLFAPRPVLPRWLLAALAAVTVLAMLLSHSRGSWVGLAVGLLVLATLRYRRLWLALLPAAALVALLPAGRALYQRVLSGFGGQDKAAGMRLDEYRNALEIVQQHPLFGIGFGAAPSIDLAPGVSSLYLTVAETIGLPGLALYLAALGILLWPALRTLLGRPAAVVQGLLASLLAALLAALTAGLFDHYFASVVFPHLVALFWLCWALLLSAVHASQADPRLDQEIPAVPPPTAGRQVSPAG
jgi:O-antigen ligase